MNTGNKFDLFIPTLIIGLLFVDHIFCIKENKTETERPRTAFCPYRPGATVKNIDRKICCNHVTEKFHSEWAGGGSYLISYLGVLKSWKCKYFTEECKNPTFAFNEFTTLAYLKECDENKLYKRCSEKIQKILDHKKENAANKNQSKSDWKTLVEKLNSNEYSIESLIEPCMQIAIYDTQFSGYGRYHEIVQPYVPFCGFVWCGVDVNTLDRFGGISPWTCMQKRCRINLAIIVSILGLLGLITIIGNATIIAVFVRSKAMRNNSQAFYKITLAIGDILVGGIVLPTSMYSCYVLFMQPQIMGKERNGIDQYPVEYEPGGLVSDVFSKNYMKFVGFFTTFSLFVSVYSLMAASFDRLYAIMRPLGYSRLRSNHVTILQCFGILLVGALFAALPFFSSSLDYQLVSAVLVLSWGKKAVVMYAITLMIPLLMIWMTTAVILFYSRKRAVIRRSMSNIRDSFEKRLAKTLAIMVGVFSLAILPNILILVITLQLKPLLSEPKILSETTSVSYNSAELVCTVILLSNSLWNVFIYSATQKDFRRSAGLIYRNSFLRLTLRSRLTERRSSSIVKSKRRKMSNTKNLEQRCLEEGCICNNNPQDGIKGHNCNKLKEENIGNNKLNDFGGTMESILEAVNSENV